MNTQSLKSDLAFAAHLGVTILAWAAPFLFNWKWAVLAYAGVMLQFAFFGRCLMNAQHEMPEEDNATFYSYVFEKMGLTPNRGRLKFYVRRVIYPVLAAAALLWQVGLGFQPLLF